MITSCNTGKENPNTGSCVMIQEYLLGGAMDKVHGQTRIVAPRRNHTDDIELLVDRLGSQYLVIFASWSASVYKKIGALRGRQRRPFRRPRWCMSRSKAQICDDGSY